MLDMANEIRRKHCLVGISGVTNEKERHLRLLEKKGPRLRQRLVLAHSSIIKTPLQIYYLLKNELVRSEIIFDFGFLFCVDLLSFT